MMLSRINSENSNEALWVTTAVTEPATLQLDGYRVCDVAIVGAGFTGLNAALRLAKAGKSVCVLEKNTIGFGASGRSGGQVNLGLNLGPTQLISLFGEERGRRLIDLVISTPGRVFDFIKQEGLQCDAVSNGWVQGAINSSIAQSQQTMVDDYSRHGFDFESLDKNAIAERTGSTLYASGIYCKEAGSLHPLSYTRELARVAMSFNASIYTDSAVTGIERESDKWRLNTRGGDVIAEQVLLCTNGYTESDTGAITQSIHKKVVPVRSVLVATEPLSDNLRHTILPDQVTFVDKRRLILYMRYDRDGRLCVGDHGPMRDTFVDSDFDNVKRRALRVFPQLENVSWQHQWGGRIAMTKSTLPFLHQVAPGLLAGMGYNGRGVGMGTMLGQTMADAILDESLDRSAFPVTKADSFVFHQFRDIGVSAHIRWFGLLDYLEGRKLQSTS